MMVAGKYRVLILLFTVTVVSPSFLKGQKNNESGLLEILDSLDRGVRDGSISRSDSTYRNMLLSIKSDALEMNSDLAYFEAERSLYSYYHFTKDTMMSLATLNKGVLEARSRGYSKAEVDFLHLKGIKLLNFEEYDSAINLFDAAFNIAVENGHNSIVPYILNSKSIAYTGLEDFDNAIDHYQMALDYSKETDAGNFAGGVFASILRLYIRLERPDSVMYYANLEKNIAQDGGSKYWLFSAYDGFVAGSYFKKDYREVLSYADTLELLVNSQGGVWSLQDAYYFKSKTYYQLDKPDSALYYVHKAIDAAKGNFDVKSIVDYLRWAVKIEKDYRKYEDALIHSERLGIILDSLDKAHHKNQLRMLQLNSELLERESLIQALEIERRLDEQRIFYRNIILVLSSAFFAILVFGVYTYFDRRVSFQKVIAREARNRLLLAQLEPHFVFNALTSIQYFMIEKKDDKEVLKYLQKFSTLIRGVLNSTRCDWISLSEEVEILRAFLDVQNLRMESMFSYSIALDTNDDEQEILIPPMFLQPFIENAIEYGAREVEKGVIDIRFCQEGDTLIVTIDDNGPGLTAARKSIKKHRSQATQITHERIDVMKKLYKKPASFFVHNRQSKEGSVIGVRVEFRLPIIKNPV